MVSFHTLLYLCLVMPVLTAALTPRRLGTPTTPKNELYRRRQVSRRALVQRAQSKTNRAKLQALRSEHDIDALYPVTPVHQYYPRASPAPGDTYPQCHVDGVNGYARYPGWDLVRDDLDGNPHYTQDRTEAESIALCDARSDCFGAVIIIGGPSYLKGSNVQSGVFQLSPHSGTTILDLLGTCADWKPYVSAAQDAQCCES